MLAGLQLNPTNRTLRQFAGTWLLLFLAVALRQFIHGHRMVGSALLLVGLVGAAGLIKPRLVKQLFIGAMIVTFPFGWAVTQVMLAIMFYVVMTPIALICRWRGRDPLQIQTQSEKSSFWQPRGDPPPPENYLQQF